MIKDEILKAQELFTAACNYNAALQAAFVSEDDKVQVTLSYNGVEQVVAIPTLHYLLSQVAKLSKQVAQLQVDDDGSDVVELLSSTNKLSLLYLQKRQFYVRPPEGAKVIKYDYETIPTEFSSADRTVMQLDMSACQLPPDAQYVIAKWDDGAIMRLPLQAKTTSFDKLCNVLSVDGEGANAVYLVDSNDLQVDDKLQCNSTVYTVTAVNGQSIQLSCDQPVELKGISAGDVMYTITDNAVVLLEVPVSSIATKLTLQVQYMHLLSAEATYNIEGMGDAIHQTLRVPLKNVIRGISGRDTKDAINTAMRSMPANLSSIVANSVPKITKTTVRQTNAHQYIHSALETMVKTNAILVQAKEDIQRYEELINTTTASIIAAGGDTENNATLLSYNEQLASTKNRYNAAQASLSNMNISAQAARPEYVATIYCSPNDSADMPVVQYIARYQYVSFEVKDITNDWSYIYGNKRTINQNGELVHPIDDYDILNSIQVPIHAYEQLVVEVAAVLQYGQPFLNVQTAFTEPIFLQIPTTLLKEVSIDEMFKNAYEAKLYTNIQQALEAAGVYRHINTNVTYAHRAQDIQYDNDDTVYTKLQSIIRDVKSLQTVAGEASLLVYVYFDNKFYEVTNNSSVDLTLSSYYANVLASKTGKDLQNALGTVFQKEFQIWIVNQSDSILYLHTMIPGAASNDITVDKYANYANIPVIEVEKTLDDKGNVTGYVNYTPKAPTEAMAVYRGKYNAIGNREIVIEDAKNFCYNVNDHNVNINRVISSSTAAYALPEGTNRANVVMSNTTEQAAALIIQGLINNSAAGYCRRIVQDYPGIGLHVGFPFSYVNQGGRVELLPSESSIATQSTNGALFMSANKLGMTFPVVDTSNWMMADYGKAGSSKLAQAYAQPGIMHIDDTYDAINCFIPDVHKYTSGRASRGAFMFLSPSKISEIQLPIYGNSNATPINPGTGKTTANAYVINGMFQARMCDRVGITDTANTPTWNDGMLAPATNGANFSYTKTMNVSVKVGLHTISFDINITMPWLD
jgi:hypothetical protein